MRGFLSVKEAVTLTGLTKKTICQNCKSGKYVTHQVKGNGGLRYEIALTSLPEFAQARYHEAVFNQQVEKLYEQERTQNTDPRVSRHQRRDGNGVSGAGYGINALSGEATDERISSRGELGMGTRVELRRQPTDNNGCAVPRPAYLATNDTSYGIGAVGLSGDGRKLQVASHRVRQGSDSVLDGSVARKDSGRDLSDYTDSQRKIDFAIKVIFTFLENFDGSEAAAIRHVNTQYVTGDLPKELRSALDNCKEKKRANAPLLSRETLHSWRKRFSTTGSYVPKKRQKDYSVKWWHNLAIPLYRRPQQPTVQYVVDKLAELVTSQGLDSKAPSYGMVDDYFKHKIGKKEMQKGRNTGMKLRSLQAHKSRTAAGLEPWDAVQSDGWASHFTAPHPISGDYVMLEIWHAHDVATKVVPPLSVGKSESYEVILKCIENATRFGGVIRILQTDSTKIVRDNQKFVGDSMVSLADRIGMTISHPKIKGNAQANGIAENFGVWLNNQAKELSSYQHESMDTLTFRRVQNLLGKLARAKFRGVESEVELLRKDIKRMAPGILFERYSDALDWLEVQRVKWNNRPHSKLPKIYDDVTGKKRHQTPQEAFEEFVSYGWQPVALDEEHIVDMLRPRKRVMVSRGKVKPYSSKVGFYHAALGRWEGKEVIVSYDIADGASVRVMDERGALICVALYDAPVGYYAPSALDVSAGTRLVQAIKRQEKKIDGLKANAGLSVIDSTASTVIELKTVDFSSVSIEESEEPKLRTLADMLAESSTGEDFAEKAVLLPYWETVSEVNDDDFKEEVL